MCFRVTSSDLKALKGRKTKYPVISGVVEVEVSWLPISTVLPLTSPRAILTVFLYSANNLGHYVSKGGAAVPLPPGYLPSARVSWSQEGIEVSLYFSLSYS